MTTETDLFGDVPAAPFATATLSLSRGAPVATAANPDSMAALTSRAVADVLAERMAQIERRGHSLEGDDRRGAAWLGDQARQRLSAAIDQLTPGVRAHPVAGRRNAIIAAALLLAAIDAHDRAADEQERGL